MGELNPTTKAQVSGHKFLKRRVEHGLVMGDIRMIHDPLARRKRALTFGIAGAALIGVGAGAMAIFAPQANPGDAAIIAAESGQLFVRVEDAYHPVSNLASARLVSGQAEDPAKADDDILSLMPKSVPVGIVDAPSIIGDQSVLPDLEWFACVEPHKRENRLDEAPDRIVFVIDDQASSRSFDAGAFIARVDNNGVDTDYLVTSEGRMKLPAADSPEGRVVRRELGMDANTTLWTPPADVLAAIKELPEFALPPRDAQVWSTGEHSSTGGWLYYQNSVARLSELQFRILESLEYEQVRVKMADVNQKDDLTLVMSMPRKKVELKDPRTTTVCVNEQGQLVGMGTQVMEKAAALGGDSVATHFVGPGRSIAVNTGAGNHLIAETGLRHQIKSDAEYTALGVNQTQDIPWVLLRLLPEGTVLSRENAVRPLY